MKINRYAKCGCGFEFVERHFHHCPACQELIEWTTNPPSPIDGIEPVQLESLYPFDVFIFNGNYYIYKTSNSIVKTPWETITCIKLPYYNNVVMYGTQYVYPVKDIQLKVKLK